MASYTTIPLKSTQTAGYWGDNLKTANAAYYKPQWHKKVLDYYPEERSLLLNATRMAGNVTTFQGDNVQVMYRGAIQRTVTIGANVAGTAASAAITGVTFNAADYYSVQGTCYARDNFFLYIPSAFTTVPTSTAPLAFLLQSHSGSGSSTTWTLIPRGAYGIASTGLPVGTVCMVGDSGFGNGDGAPDGLNEINYTETFYPQIAKEALRADGNVTALQTWEDELENGEDAFLRGTELSHLRLDAQLETAAWLGTKDVNTLLVSKNHISGRSDSAIHTAQGIIPKLDVDGMSLPYTDTSNIVTVLGNLKLMNETQMITENRIKGFFGPNLMNKFEDDELNYLKSQSFTDITKGMQQLGYAVHVIYSHGLYIECFEMPSWGKPNSYGATGMPFPDLGVLIPNSQAKVSQINGLAQENVTFNNLTLGFFSNKGLDRTRVARLIGGASGRTAEAYNEYDSDAFVLLTNFTWLIFHANQMTLLKKTTSSSLV